MADVLYEALKPYVGAGWLNQQESGLNDFGWRNYKAIAGNRAAFDPSESLQLMKTYNDAYKLGLTDAEIATGITRFGQWHVNQFGGGLAADSSIPAVAAQSLAEAITAKGGNGYASAFWQDVAKPGGILQLGNEAAIQKGKDVQAAITADWNNNIAVHGTGLTDGVAREYGGNSFADLVLAAAPMVMAAVVGPAVMAEFGGAALAGEVGSLAAADAAAGLIPAADLAAMTGTAATTAGITGNAAIDTYLSNLPSSMARNAAIQLVKNGDIDLGQLATGAVTGGLNAYGNTLVSDLGLDPSIAKGLTSAVVGTGVGLISGQDVGSALTGGLISGAATGVGNAVGTAVRDNMVDNEIANAAAQNNTAVDGEQAFAEDPVEPVQPPPVDTGTGGFSNLVSDLVSPNTAGSIAGTVAGNVTGAVIADTVTDTPDAAPITDTPAEPDTPIASVSFSSVLPQNVTDADRTTDWTGTRLMDAGRI